MNAPQIIDYQTVDISGKPCLEVRVKGKSKTIEFTGTISFNSDGYKYQGTNGKGHMPVERIEKFWVKNEDGFFALMEHVGADDKWNNIQKVKHPIRWKLGLVTKYDEYNSVLAVTASEDVQKSILKAISELGLPTEN